MAAPHPLPPGPSARGARGWLRAERSKDGSPAVGPLGLLGLALVPVLVAVAFVTALWQPTEHLQRVQAAVVNLDEPVEIDGQPVPVGRLVVSELVGDDSEGNLSWSIADEEGAEDGLADGTYAVVVTIPETFSAAATSLQDTAGTPQQATLDVRTTSDGAVADPFIGQLVATTASDVLREQLSRQVVDGLYVGFSQLGDGLEQGADGARQVGDGAGDLGDGAEQLADGGERAAVGLGELADGADQLAGGTRDVSDGTRPAPARMVW